MPWNGSCSDGWGHAHEIFLSLWGLFRKAGELCEEPALVLGDVPQWVASINQAVWCLPLPRCSDEWGDARKRGVSLGSARQEDA